MVLAYSREQNHLKKKEIPTEIFGNQDFKSIKNVEYIGD